MQALTPDKAAYFDRMRLHWLECKASGRTPEAMTRYNLAKEEEWKRAKAGVVCPAIAPEPPAPARKAKAGPKARLVATKAVPRASAVPAAGSVTAGEFMAAIDKVGTGRGRPILSTLLCRPDGTVTFTNLEVFLTAPGGPKVGSPVCIDLDFLRALPRKTPLSEIGIKGADDEGRVCAVHHGLRSAPCLSADEFPEVPGPLDPGTSGHGSIPVEAFAAIAFAASTDVNKKMLNGIAIESQKVIATDGHRLAFASVATGLQPKGEISRWTRLAGPDGNAARLADAALLDENERLQPIGDSGFVLKDGYKYGERSRFTEIPAILPARPFTRLFRGGALLAGGTCTQFQSGPFTVTVRHLEGNYPDWRRVVPESCRIKAVFSRATILDLMDRIRNMASDKDIGFKMELNGDNTARISFNNPGVVEFSQEVPCEYKGDPLLISFNFRYIMEAAKSLTGRDIEFEFDESRSPAMIRESYDSWGQTHIVMPMMI